MKTLEQQLEYSKSVLAGKIEEFYKNAYNELNGIKTATLWYRWLKNAQGFYSWEFNHLEDGHCPNKEPTPKCEYHKSAWRGKWAKAHVQLVNGKVSHYLIY